MSNRMKPFFESQETLGRDLTRINDYVASVVCGYACQTGRVLHVEKVRPTIVRMLEAQLDVPVAVNLLTSPRGQALLK
jgi:hypothetical protein